MHRLLSKVEATPHDGRYRITLVDWRGVELHAEMEIRDHERHVVGNPDPDVFGQWDGDAESVRLVGATVVALHRARMIRPQG